MRPIDADELKKRGVDDGFDLWVSWKDIDSMPTIDAVPVVHGEWTTKRTWQHDGEIYCSVCDSNAPTEGDYRQVKTNYCPNCGAKMDGERKEK